MSGSGSILSNGGGLEALLKAAKYVEEQEKQKLRRQSSIHRSSETSEGKESPVPVVLPVSHNGLHTISNASRIPTPPLPRHGSVIREVHNKLEKNRRAHLKECFETLKKQLPPSPDEKKTSNLSILHNAIRYIAVLKRKEREFEHEMERLARDKIAYQQRLATLKKELTAQWEHIDLNTLLPDVVGPEPRRTRDLLNGRIMESSVGAGSDEDMVRTSTRYSSTSSLSSASPLHSDTHTHHAQVVSSPGPGPPSLLMSPLQQLLPPTTIRMLPADTNFVHSHIPTTGITIQNGVINHSGVTLTTKHPAATGQRELGSYGMNSIGDAAAPADHSLQAYIPQSTTLVASSLLNHSLVMPQPSGSFLLAAPSQIGEKVVSGPVLKSLPLQPPFLVKPTTMVVVSAAANTQK